MANYRINSDQTKHTIESCLLALKALSDESRLRALLALRQRELCHCQLVELLELAPSTVSKHLSLLRQARLIESRKVGKWIYFRAAESDGKFPHELSELITLHTKSADQSRSDRKRLREILQIDPEQLCASHRDPSRGRK